MTSFRPLRASLALVLALVQALACNGDDTATSATSSGGETTTTDATEGDTTTSTTTTGSTAGTTGVPAGETRYFLRIDDNPVPPVVLEMDKEKALEVFGEAAARDLVLIEVDGTQMLRNALEQIQGSCGTSWTGNSKNPYHDCTKTPLGKTYGADWKTSPQFSLVRMLTMTPTNAVVTGTSLEALAAYLEENQISVKGKVYTLKTTLSEALKISPNQAFISLDDLVQALKETLLFSHKEIANKDGLLKVTLWDAANDMTPLAEKYGPYQGPDPHPGVLYPDDDTFTTRSDALGPDFKMKVVAESNLRLVSGIDLSVGAGDMFVSDAASILSFDFNDPEKLVIEGVTAMPTVDMRFRVGELNGVIPSCLDGEPCKDNTPTTPVGVDGIWSQKPFLLEYLVSYAAKLAYDKPTQDYELCILANGSKTVCYTGIWIGPHNDPLTIPPPSPPGPTGWSIFKALDEPVPPPQFLWELLLEIAQVALHDPSGDGKADIEEGQMNPLFTLKGISIGLTGEEMIAQIRPKMQEQADKVANVILGKYWKNNGALDFYYRRATAGGPPLLYFVGEDDKRPSAGDPDTIAAYNYARPGFFSCPELSDACKVSTKDMPGVADTAHEKVQLPPGASTLYAQDDEGATYAVGFYVPAGADPVEIVATVDKL